MNDWVANRHGLAALHPAQHPAQGDKLTMKAISQSKEGID